MRKIKGDLKKNILKVKDESRMYDLKLVKDVINSDEVKKVVETNCKLVKI